MNRSYIYVAALLALLIDVDYVYFVSYNQLNDVSLDGLKHDRSIFLIRVVCYVLLSYSQ